MSHPYLKRTRPVQTGMLVACVPADLVNTLATHVSVRLLYQLKWEYIFFLQMYFHNGLTDYVLFESWIPCTVGRYVGTLVAILFTGAVALCVYFVCVYVCTVYFFFHVFFFMSTHTLMHTCTHLCTLADTQHAIFVCVCVCV